MVVMAIQIVSFACNVLFREPSETNRNGGVLEMCGECYCVGGYVTVAE